MQSETEWLLERSKSVKETCCGPRVVWQGLTKKERILFIVFIALASLCWGGAAVISGFRTKHLDHNSAKFTFCIVVIINAVFCIVFAILGPIFQRVSDFAMILLAFVIGLTIAVIDAIFTWNKDSTSIRVAIILVCVGSLLAIGAAVYKIRMYILHDRMTMVSAGTLPHAQKLHSHKNCFRSALLFDVQISFSVVAVLWPEGPHFGLDARIVIIPATAASITMCILGYIIVKIEEKHKCYIPLWCIYAVLWLGNFAFDLFVIIEASKKIRPRDNTLAQDGIYVLALVMCSVSIILRIVTAVLCYKIFAGVKGQNTIQTHGDASGKEETVLS